jgi:hypothetical protein
MNLNLLFFYLLILSLISCNQELQTLELETEQKLVVWCYLHPDSTATALVSKTGQPFSKKEERRVNDAIVLLLENGLIADTLRYVDSSIYRSIHAFKPKAKQAYCIKILHSNFKTIETKTDTMPTPPKLIKYTANDSVMKLEQGQNLARLQLFTDVPQYFYAYGLSPAMYKGVNYLGVYGDATKTWKLKANDCGIHFGIRDYTFKTPICEDKPFDFYEFTTQATSRNFRTQKVKFSMCSVTKETAIFLSNSFKYYYANFDDFYDTELFWNPSSTPPEYYVKNGYGFLGCYNTTNFEVQF